MPTARLHVLLKTVLLVCILSPLSASAQGVQAVRNLAEEAEDEARGESIAEIMFLAGQRLAIINNAQSEFKLNAEATGRAEDIDAASIVTEFDARLVGATKELFRTRDDPDDFERAVRDYNELVREYDARFSSTPAIRAGVRVQGFNDGSIGENRAMGPLPLPGPHTLVKDVVWVLAGGGGFGDHQPVYELGVSTNLLGSALATAFGVFGSTDLTDYVKNNVSAGAGMPLSGENRLTSSFGLGLGGVRFGQADGKGRQVSMWPVLSVGQADSSDQRMPNILRDRAPDQASWSSPAVSVAFTFFSNTEFARRVENGQPIPVFSIGLRLPFYYPGDPAAALAAIFTDDRKKYERAGDVQFLVSGSIPLLRLDRRPQSR